MQIFHLRFQLLLAVMGAVSLITIAYTYIWERSARAVAPPEREMTVWMMRPVSAKNKSHSLREFHKFLAQLPRSKSQTIGIIKACCVNNSQIKQSYNENETILNWESMYKWPSLSGPPRSFRPQRALGVCVWGFWIRAAWCHALSCCSVAWSLIGARSRPKVIIYGSCARQFCVLFIMSAWEHSLPDQGREINWDDPANALIRSITWLRADWRLVTICKLLLGKEKCETYIWY